jgi:hypothetical protein
MAEYIDVRQMVMNEIVAHATPAKKELSMTSDVMDKNNTQNQDNQKFSVIVGKEESGERVDMLVCEKDRVLLIKTKNDQKMVYEFSYKTGQLHKNKQEILNNPQQTFLTHLRNFKSSYPDLKLFSEKGVK